MCVQYRWDILIIMGDMSSTVRDNLSTVGDISITMKAVQYCGGHQVECGANEYAPHIYHNIPHSNEHLSWCS